MSIVLVVVAAVWSGFALLAVALCAMAARADREMAAPAMRERPEPRAATTAFPTLA